MNSISKPPSFSSPTQRQIPIDYVFVRPATLLLRLEVGITYNFFSHQEISNVLTADRKKVTFLHSIAYSSSQELPITYNLFKSLRLIAMDPSSKPCTYKNKLI